MARRYPDSAVFYRKLDKTFPLAVRGDGCWIIDESGKRYLDAVGGAYVANLGHGVREVADAMGAQAGRIAYVNGTAFANEAAEALAAELAPLCPGDLKKSYFLTSGSEAVEAALKLARQHWVEAGRPSKRAIIATSPGYHGNTLLALSVSARGSYRAMFKDWLADVVAVPAPYPYRCPCGGASASCAACSGAALEEAILEQGPENVAAFITEPIGGSSTGASVPRPDHYRRVREICDKHKVLFIADEVLTGAGRTGRWSAMDHYGVAPDIMVLGKGLSGGYAPLSAVVTSQRVLDPIARGSGALLHAQTFSHTPLICAAGLAAVRYIKKNKLIERCRKMGEVLHRKLAALKDLPAVGDVRGKGLLAGIEFVADKASKAPFPRTLAMGEAFVKCALEEGLIVWLNTGHADGTDGDLVMVAPPFTISEAELDELVSRFSRALERTFAVCPAARQAGARL